MLKKVQHIYSKQKHDTQSYEFYRETLILNEFFK